MIEFLSDALKLGIGTAKFITGSAAAAKSIIELARKPNPDMTEIKRLAIEVIDQLLEAKTAQMETQNALINLQNEQDKWDHFKLEAARYVLTKTDMGSLVYSLRPEHIGGEPAHDLCANCFNRAIKAVLQPANFNTLACSQCGANVLKSDGRSSAAYGRVESRNMFSDY